MKAKEIWCPCIYFFMYHFTILGEKIAKIKKRAETINITVYLLDKTRGSVQKKIEKIKTAQLEMRKKIISIKLKYNVSDSGTPNFLFLRNLIKYDQTFPGT